MIKNIVLFVLGILFLLWILHYSIQCYSFKEGLGLDYMASQNAALTPELIKSIESTLALQSTATTTTGSGVIPSNIILNLGELNIQDSTIRSILVDPNTIDVDKIKKISDYINLILKPSLVKDGLILHYSFNKIDNGKVLNEALETKGEFDGIVFGTTKIDQSDYKYGNGSIRFSYINNTSTDYIKIPSVPKTFYNADNEFQGYTCACWYKYTENSPEWSRLYEFATGPAGNNCLGSSVKIVNEPKFLSAAVRIPGWNEWNVCATMNTLGPGTWHHVATTISVTGKYTIYVNGKKALTNMWTEQSGIPTNVTRTQNYIAYDVWNSGTSGFDGWMNDFRIYRKELTAEKIKQIYDLRYVERNFTFGTSVLIHINSKREKVIVDENKILKKCMDYTQNNNNAFPITDNMLYCPKNQVITIPIGSYLRIDSAPNTTFKSTSFTMGVVANVKSFNPNGRWNCLIGAYSGGMTVYFRENRLVMTSQGNYLNYTFDSNNITNINENAVNIFIIKIDNNHNVTISINGIALIENANLLQKDQNYIQIGGIHTPDWASVNEIDFYEFMYISEFYEYEKQAFLEGYLAQTWGLKQNLPSDHPYKT